MTARLIVWLLIAGGAQADDWGTLFFSPAQRAQPQNVNPLAIKPDIASAPQSRHYNGVLQTPRQKTHWIDGQIAPAPANSKPGESIEPASTAN
jgi:hypothetical protein